MRVNLNSSELTPNALNHRGTGHSEINTKLRIKTLMLAVLSMVLYLTVSPNFLTMIGVPYVSEGGNILVKLHCGTWLIILCFSYSIIFEKKRFLSVTGITIPGQFCIASMMFMLASISAMIFCGSGNCITIVDGFLPAAFIGYIMSDADTAGARRALKIIRSVIFINALMAVCEVFFGRTLLPLYLTSSSKVYLSGQNDFRALALSEHPLSGAYLCLLGISLSPTDQLKKFIYDTILWLAILGFGSRAALFSAGAVVLIRSINNKKYESVWTKWPPVLSGKRETLLIILILILAASLGVGTRIFNHFRYDPSAAARLSIWEVLGQLPEEDFIIGCPRSVIVNVIEPIYLQTGTGVIENSWLSMFINLGIIGGIPFIYGVFYLLRACWRITNQEGRVALIFILIVVSTSNILARKSSLVTISIASISLLKKENKKELVDENI